MDNIHLALRKRFVINTKLFYEDFIATVDQYKWAELDKSLQNLVTFSEKLQDYDDVSEDLKTLSDATIQLKKDFIDGDKDSVEERHQIDRRVKSIKDGLIQRFGDA